jgi:REP element-mobilizing transposase RayT
MDTHLHLLLESRKSNLSEFMRRLLTAYTVWFNKRHQIHGHLFAGRFKSLVVERGEYLVSVSRYIHRNPVEAGLVDNAEDYPWSSMRIYAGKASSKIIYAKEILYW